MVQRSRFFVLPILLCAVFAPAASASTAYVSEAGQLVVLANPGEQNYVTVVDPGVTTEVGDTAGITAGAGCEAMTATRVRCPGFNPSGGIGKTLITLGDGNDFYHEQTELYQDDVDAGAGDDEVYGSRETDLINGGEGNDTLHGGGADDTINGGPGDDTIKGSSDNDTIDGGAGADLIEGDGDGFHDGSDTITANDGEVDRVGCGGGNDKVTADQADEVHATCDVVERVGGGDDPEVSVTVKRTMRLSAFLSSGFAFTATADREVAFAAALFVPAKAARRLGLGSKTVRIASGVGSLGPGTAKGVLTKRFKTSRLRELLRQGGTAIPVVFQALAQDAAGATATVRRRSKLTR